MDRNEFVSTLRAVLTGEVPGAVVEDNVRYYDSYISQEIAGGKSERGGLGISWRSPPDCKNHYRYLSGADRGGADGIRSGDRKESGVSSSQ